jgi:cytochrome c-type biogenesis protein CcmH/NrfG
MLKRTFAKAVASLVCLVMLMAMLPVGLFGQKASSEVDRDETELQQYRLTMPKIRQMAAATLAFAKEMEQDPALAAKIKHSDDPEPKTLADFAARINKEPRLAAAITAAGLTPREYATLVLCYFPTMFAYALKKQGAIKELPKNILSENLALIEANEAELTRINKELEAHDTSR